MKLTCFIVSTLLIVFITQQSTNGLPVDDVTTQLSCTEGFELLNGECQPIFSSSQKSDTEFNRSKFEKATVSYEGTTEQNKKVGESVVCPEGTVRTSSGDCKDIAFEDQSSTTPKSKKIGKTLEEHEKEPSDLTNEPVKPERKPKLPEDEPERKPKLPEDEPERKPKLPKDEPERKPKLPKDEPKEQEKELLDHTSEPVVGEKESSGSKGEKSDTPKGCPPGTKVDEEGACQDEVEHTSTTLTMNLKDLLPKGGLCPVGMELFKNKCIYIKSKDNSTVDGLMETGKSIVDKDNTEKKLVPVLKGGVCPLDTEYYSNGLCRVRTRTSPVKVISVKEICPLGGILIDGKCQQKGTEQSKTTKVPLKSKPSTQDGKEVVESL